SDQRSLPVAPLRPPDDERVDDRAAPRADDHWVDVDLRDRVAERVPDAREQRGDAAEAGGVARRLPADPVEDPADAQLAQRALDGARRRGREQPAAIVEHLDERPAGGHHQHRAELVVDEAERELDVPTHEWRDGHTRTEARRELAIRRANG